MRRLENLFLMTAGGRSSNSVELLSLEKMRNFIQYLRSEFDTIILDAPPIAPISDCQILAGLSDGLILVVRSGKTSYANIERAVRFLDPSKLLGLVLNDVPPLLFNTQYDPSYYGSASLGRFPYGSEDTRTGRSHRSYLDN
jgi:receptor protein-tyrosine kinase